MRGLLSADGKKTIRALAGRVGGNVEQSLYQFISKSPWDAGEVRRELARLFHEAAGPTAWVVRPLVITKVGRHTVGVERQFVSQLGRTVNCQQGMGIWLASDRMSCPVEWRLALPECWTGDPGLRKRASIPDEIGPCPPERCATTSLAVMADDWRLPVRPVVMDLRESDPYPVCSELAERQIPFVVRIDPAAPQVALELCRPRPGRTGPTAFPTPAELVTAVSRRSLPVEWFDHLAGMMRATAVGSAPVRLRGRAGRAAPPEFVLLGAWGDPGARSPSEYWLSNLSQPRLGTVYRTAMLSRRIERDLAGVSDPLGVRDFEGRSFRGWHHHMTMVSLAHALTVIDGDRRAAAGPPAELRGAKAAAA